MVETNARELEPLRDWASPVFPAGEEPGVEETEYSLTGKPPPAGPLIKRVAVDLFCLAWIAPMITLLVLNFTGWTVGAGVGCRLKSLKRDCYVDLLDSDGPDAEERAEKLNKKDHEILGTLQFVAKALEIWFTVIAASLIYDLTILLALKIDGLPIGYLMTHAEFGDIVALFERALWGSSGLLRPAHPGERVRRFWLFFFMLFVIVLCITCNLMGPSTAVLVLPTLGWSQISYTVEEKLGQMALSDPPANPLIAPDCNASSLGNGDYTCTDYYSPAVDSHSSLAVFNYGELWRGYHAQSSIGRESGLSFLYNSTSQGDVLVPNRQVIRELSNDYIVYQVTQGIDQTFEGAVSLASQNGNLSVSRELFDSYRNSLDVKLSRKGPSVRINSLCSRGNLTGITLSETKSVHCFNSSLAANDSVVECFRIGGGWNEAGFAHSQFSIGDVDIHSAGNVSVDVYSVPGGIILDGSSLSCASPTASSQSCDWDLMFSANPPPGVRDDPGNVQIFEYSLPRLSSANSTIGCVNVVDVKTLEYIIDISPDANSIGIVTLNASSTDDGQPDYVKFHPDWVLAAWAIPRSGIVDGNRAVALNLVSALKVAVDSPPPAVFNYSVLDPDLDPFTTQHVITSLHAASLVDFTTINVTGSSADTADPSHPPLPVSRTLRVWAYGHDSHTFKLGATITIFGCLCVLLRFIVGFFISSRRRSTLRFLTAAMKYTHQGEFDGLEKESEWAQVEVVVSHDDSGKVEFFPRKAKFGSRSS
ncbi:hypothetical protein GP486_000258 [Trichoglossum hirsutum]|uniref:Uncharacterized protein n=1 Tax=Trichoglossum hirsutum TaxID=265104 RepID=A0A9P8LJ96_9PEZI|nr:hypothetical protein GP486_000258 [Trichoglossum hirsutum]